MYATPALLPLDLTTTSASCCRVVATGGGLVFQRTNEQLCPFPAPTGDICVVSVDTSTLGTVSACAYAN